MMAWEAKHFSVVCSAELLQEYDWVINDPDIATLLSPELVRAFRSHLIYDVEVVAVPSIPRYVATQTMTK